MALEEVKEAGCLINRISPFASAVQMVMIYNDIRG